MGCERGRAGSGATGSHDSNDDVNLAAECRPVDVVRDSGLAIGAGPDEVCAAAGLEESDGAVTSADCSSYYRPDHQAAESSPVSGRLADESEAVLTSLSI